MGKSAVHSFHIPVMGLGFTIDTPVKVAHYGISSVISIIDDVLIEYMRKHYCNLNQLAYTHISDKEEDHRAKRITAYLNLVNDLVTQKTESLRQQPFEEGSDIVKYFEMLSNDSEMKLKYENMLQTNDEPIKEALQKELRLAICAGSIDVNIMSKIDNLNFAKDGTPLPKEFSDALSALRGFALSNLRSSVVFSAGYNPSLYASIGNFDDFYPDESGISKKKIILVVSDYRSAVTQGKLLAKKGLWVSEFRIESGLNCGGHAFATEGLLIGPILEEFKINRIALIQELFIIYKQALSVKEKNIPSSAPYLRVTVQGGIGTSHEDKFLQEHYKTNGTGWGSPFLLVPEVTNVDEETLQNLSTAQPEDYFLSNASPLGVPFNNFRKSSSEKQRLQRIANDKPGNPCYRKYLVSNTEFTEKPICTASRQYQRLKIRELKGKELSKTEFDLQYKEITDKDCLCIGLTQSALLNNKIEIKLHLPKVAICPGPNLAYFSGIFSLKQMVDHIYGRTNILNSVKRPNMFVKELGLYVDYLKKEIEMNADSLNNKKIRYLKTFQDNLLEGVNYYQNLKAHFLKEIAGQIDEMSDELNKWEMAIKSLRIPATI